MNFKKNEKRESYKWVITAGLEIPFRIIFNFFLCDSNKNIRSPIIVT